MAIDERPNMFFFWNEVLAVLLSLFSMNMDMIILYLIFIPAESQEF